MTENAHKKANARKRSKKVIRPMIEKRPKGQRSKANVQKVAMTKIQSLVEGSLQDVDKNIAEHRKLCSAKLSRFEETANVFSPLFSLKLLLLS